MLEETQRTYDTHIPVQEWKDWEFLEALEREGSAAALSRATGQPVSTIKDHKKRVLTKNGLGALAEETDQSVVGAAQPTARVSGSFAQGSRSRVDVEAIKREAASRYRSKNARAEKKKNQRIEFDGGPVALFFVGDQHIGNAGTDIERVFAEQDLILDTPGSFVWLMGDGVDNFIVRMLMAENMKPSVPVYEQWVLYEEYIDRFEKRLVAMNSGNHDAWTQKVSSLDYARRICPDGVLYDGDEIKASVWVGDHEYKIMSRHKYPGFSMYNSTHGQERYARFDDPNFDVYVGAHIHKGAMSREFIHDGRRKLSILTGAYKIHDDYARVQGFVRHDASTAVGVVLHEDGSFFAAADIQAISNYMQAVYGRVA